MRKLAVILAPLLFGQCARADLVRVTHQRLTGPLGGSFVAIEFDIRWNNSFRDSANWDAAWVFVKYRIDQGPWLHATLSSQPGHRSVGNDRGVPATVDVTADGKGAVIYRAVQGTGPADWRDVRLRWEYAIDGVPDGSQASIRVYGLEMVHVPGGSFALGDGERGDVRGHFHGPTAARPFVVTSEDPITLGGKMDGRLSSNNGYGMRQSFADDFDENTTVVLPRQFPKGFAPFYVMKHELAQGQYAQFLNTLTPDQLRPRNPANEGAPARPGIDRYTITAVPPFEAAADDRPAHFLSWMDGAAFADWAALRPMTELEFEKAARGGTTPHPGEFAWGSDKIHDRWYTLSQVDTHQELVANPGVFTGNAAYAGTTGSGTRCWSCLSGPLRAGAFRSQGATREESGASYFGLLHLSGNLVERFVSIGDAAGRRFTGRHGDGRLNARGNAAGPEVSSWPGSSNTGQQSQVIGAVGSGLRGGSWASPAGNLRISDREFAATPDNSRQPTFGYRFARSAPQR